MFNQNTAVGFGTRVKAAFDDGQEHTGVIIGHEKNKGARITCFQDGTEARGDVKIPVMTRTIYELNIAF